MCPPTPSLRPPDALGAREADAWRPHAHHRSISCARRRATCPPWVDPCCRPRGSQHILELRERGRAQFHSMLMTGITVLTTKLDLLLRYLQSGRRGGAACSAPIFESSL